MLDLKFGQIEGVLLDLWGTLIYNTPNRGRKEYEALARQIGHPVEEIWRRWAAYSKEALRGQIKSGEERARRILQELGGPLELAAEMARFEYDNRGANPHFYPGVPEMLA